MAQSIRGFSNRQQTVRRGIAPGVRRKGSANSPGGCRDASSPDQSRSSRQRPDSDKSLSYTPSSNQCGPRQSDPKARYRLLGIASHNGPWEGHTDHSLQASSSRNRACGAPAVALICCGGPAQWFVSQTGKGEEVLPPGSGCLSSHLTLEVSGPVQPICFSSDFLALPAGLLLHLSPPVSSSILGRFNDQAVPSARARMSSDKGPLHRHFEPHRRRARRPGFVIEHSLLRSTKPAYPANGCGPHRSIWTSGFEQPRAAHKAFPAVTGSGCVAPLQASSTKTGLMAAAGERLNAASLATDSTNCSAGAAAPLPPQLGRGWPSAARHTYMHMYRLPPRPHACAALCTSPR